MSDDSNNFSAAGFAILGEVASRDEVATLINALQADAAGESRQRRGGLYAVRNLLRVAVIRHWAESRKIMEIIRPVLGPCAKPVRGMLFDKTAATNWKVAWHQDLSIAVKERMDVPGFGPWSIKAGVPHVQPAVEVLENMLTLRLHLDDCGEDNGPLRVLPGSQAAGVLDEKAIAAWRERVAAVACVCPAAGALLMRPLLLHASSQATAPAHRRVVHIEYASGALPGGLEWHED